MDGELIKKRNKEIVELLKQNFTANEIVSRLKNKYFITINIVKKIESSDSFKRECAREERESRNKEIIKLWLKGYGYKEIAYELQITYNIVSDVVYRYKIRHPNIVTKRDKDMQKRNIKIYSEYLNGTPIICISKKYFLSYSRTYSIIREMKEKVRVD